MNPILVCKNISKNYQSTVAVEDLSISVTEGEIISILGASGCGKTTLLRLIAGFEKVDNGEITLRNDTVSSTQKHTQPENRNIGMVFQEYSLFPHMNVAENITFGLKGYSKSNQQNRLKEVLELIHLNGFENRYPNELSGGQQQRIALARTLAPKPEIILLDEPFSNLDALTRKAMVTDMNKIILESKTASILVTHDREEAFAIADTLAVMVDGEIVQIDKPDNIYNQPNSIDVAKLVANCSFLEGEVINNSVNTIIGSFPYKTFETNIPNHKKVKLLIHPEDFLMSYDPNGPFKVIGREYRGSHTINELQSVQYGFNLHCRESVQYPFQLGTLVNLVKTDEKPFVIFPV
tara:strand:+ start:1216 stop:2265 length:1050 start_codon:yes stop_codon:yes gene_type:complete